jgi:hypothetical protein
MPPSFHFITPFATAASFCAVAFFLSIDAELMPLLLIFITLPPRRSHYFDTLLLILLMPTPFDIIRRATPRRWLAYGRRHAAAAMR